MPFEEDEQLKTLNCMNKPAKEGEEEEKVDDTSLENQHVFHDQCITEWFYKKLECPMCRATFTEEIDTSVQVEGDDEEEKDEDVGNEAQEVALVRERMNQLLASVQNIQRGIESLRNEQAIVPPAQNVS